MLLINIVKISKNMRPKFPIAICAIENNNADVNVQTQNEKNFIDLPRKNPRHAISSPNATTTI